MIHLNIGSNKGDRAAMIDRAVSLISLAFPGEALRVSHPVETEPWGYVSANRYLNVGITLDVHVDDAPALLDKVKAIERQISREPHRDNLGGYCDRPIDIDIIAVDDMIYHSDRLDVPHRHMAERDFVLIPFAELCPDWRHPLLGKTAVELLNDLTQSNVSDR